ncbi:MAG TPA: hypothetical protein ENK98_07535 [Epsilonproteobacteria bacterium]|nr:hypothetical protein [Campylobacterota bacterium]
MNLIYQYLNPELVYVVSVCSVILLVVVGGYVFMFLLIMKNDPKERQFRQKHDWDNSLVPHKYKDEK